MKKILSALGIAAMLASGCTKIVSNDADTTASSLKRANMTVSGTLYGPVSEIKFYKLFNSYSSSDDFEASGIYALGNYYYAVFDNRWKIGKILNTLPVNSSSNTLTGSGSGSSNFEAITYDDYNTPNWYVGIESEAHNSAYYPKIREYDASLTYQNADWTDISFFSSNNNKALEGMAWLRRNGDDYILALIESTGKIYVLKQTSSGWTTQASFYPPVIFTDYSDIALYGNKIAITSQEDSRLWIGTLSATSWSVVDSGKVYDFPRGDQYGNAGMGTYKIYGTVEGVSFINDSTIVTCTDKAGSSDPSYMKYKDQSLQVFKIR